jgi:hypothetical protein
MVRRVLIVLCFGFMTVFMGSCGQTYKLLSISVTPGALGATGSSAINIEGIGTFQSLTVTALYSNTKTEDVTGKSQYQIGASLDPNAPLSATTVNGSGVVKAVGGVCTWVAEPTDSPTNSAFSYGTSPYTVTITYSGFTTVAFVSVNSLPGCYDPANPAPKGFPGN